MGYAARMERSLDSYAAGYLARRAAADRAAAVWQSAVRGRLDVAVDALVREFGATRVVLFGSLARGEARPGSDVDLLVEGVPLDRLMVATARVARLVATDVDLVPVEHALEAIVARARAEGEVLHG